MSAPVTDVAGPVGRPRLDRFTAVLLGIVALGLAVRLVYIFTTRQDFFADFVTRDPFKLGDAYLYQRGAVLLAEGKGFVNPYQYDLLKITQQDASHPPLFMLWLWLPALVGITSATAHAVWSALLGAGTIALVGVTGRRVAGPRVGLIAALLAAVYPNVFSHDAFLQSETMAIFTVTLTVWAAYRFVDRPSTGNAVWLAVGCSTAMLSRSELVLLVPVLLVPLLLRAKVDRAQRGKWLGAAALTGLVLVGPWVGYNLSRFDQPVTLSDNFGYTLLTATCDTTYYGVSTGYWDYGCAAPVYDRIDAPNNDRSENDVVFRRHALDYISEHRGRVAVVTLVRWARFTGIWDLTHGFDQVHKDIGVEGREPYIAWISGIMWWVLAPFGVLGAVALWRRRRAVWPLLAPLVVVWIAVTLTFYMNRYRASAETAVCLLAAVGVDALVRRLRRRDPTVA